MTNSYTDVFTGNPVQVSPTGYRSFSFGISTFLSWPQNNENNANVAVDVQDVIAISSGTSLVMPPANQVSNGKSCIFKNIGANSFNITDNGLNIICTVAPGQVWWVYVKDNSSVNGSWGNFQYGATTSAANASSLAGLGLTAIGTLLNVAFPVAPYNTTHAFVASDRATVSMWTGGAGAYTFPNASVLGNNWFVIIKNAGSGALTLTPSGSMIDGVSSISINPNGSCIIACDGTNYYSIGLGIAALTTFTRLSLSVAGSANVTLTSSQAGFDIQEYTGTLTGNINVIVPTQVGRWWVYNNTTGAFTLKVKTSGGTGVFINQGTRTIIHCDGTNVVFSQDTTAGTVTNIATGTGLTGGPITATGTVSIANTAVTAGTYGDGTHFTNFVVNQQGQLTAASQVVLGDGAFRNTGGPYIGVDISNNLTINAASIDGGRIAAATISGSNIVSNVALAGSPTTTTQTPVDSSTKIATTAFVQNQSGSTLTNSFANTQGFGNTTLAIANCAFVWNSVLMTPGAFGSLCGVNNGNGSAYVVGTTYSAAAVGQAAGSWKCIFEIVQSGVTINWFFQRTS